MIFKNYYKFPLTFDTEFPYKVFTKDGEMAFDFALLNDLTPIPIKDKEKIVNTINGITNAKPNNNNFKYEDGYISAKLEDNNWYKIILIRGWGMLIDIGGYSLSTTKAAQIQDEFGNHITNKLNGK